MGLYSRWLFPRLCDLILRQPFVTKLRRELLAHVEGNVLEVGLGTGLNLPCYPAQVRRITTVDPNPGMHALARRRMRRWRIHVDHHVQSSERLPFSDAVFDRVVSTFTLCSIERVQDALAEIHRVLKPGGVFLFLEHGLSRDPHVQRWQRRLDPLEQLVADGCRLTRDIRALVAEQEFGSLEVVELTMPGVPATHGYLYRGLGRK